MISQEEFSACQRGDMQLVSGKLMNLNQGGSHIPTGMMVALYVRRARKLQVDALLGKPLEETVYVNF